MNRARHDAPRPGRSALSALLAGLLLGLGCAPERTERASTQIVSEAPTVPEDRAGPPAGRRAWVPDDRPLRAGFVLVDGVYNTELVAPWDIFEHTRHHTAPAPGIEVFTVAATADPVTTAENLRILPDHTFETAPPIDILVVPSAKESRGRDLENRELIRWVRQAGEQAAFVLSLCWGAFVLAEAGLLDGHACTTFPSDYELFSRRFPELDLRVNVTYVHDGKALTSEGGAPSYGAAMYLVDFLYGEEVAQRIGAGLLVPWPSAQPAEPSAAISDPAYVAEFGG